MRRRMAGTAFNKRGIVTQAELDWVRRVIDDLSSGRVHLGRGVATRFRRGKRAATTVATMLGMVDGSRVSPSVDCQTLLETAAALRPAVRGYQVDIERDRQIPIPLVEQLRAAGLYRMVIPHELGGLQVDLLTFLRAAELIAEGDGSVGWNLANNAVGQFVALSLPDEGVEEIFAHGPDTIVAGTAV